MHLHNGSGAELDRCLLASRDDIHRRSRVAYLRNGVVPDAKPVNEDLTLIVGFQDNVIAICSGNSESEALDLAVRGGLDNFQVASHRIIDEADACLVLHLVGLAVCVDHHFIHAGIKDKPLRCFGFLDEVATIE